MIRCIGRWLSDGSRHAWVLYEQHGQTFLMETTRKRYTMSRPLHEVWEDYRPEYGISSELVSYKYEGANIPPPRATG